MVYLTSFPLLPSSKWQARKFPHSKLAFTAVAMVIPTCHTKWRFSILTTIWLVDSQAERSAASEMLSSSDWLTDSWLRNSCCSAANWWGSCRSRWRSSSGYLDILSSYLVFWYKRVTLLSLIPRLCSDDHCAFNWHCVTTNVCLRK